MALELMAYLSYSRIDEPLQYWRSTSKFEVDFVVGCQLAIEVKGTNHVVDKHLKGLRALAEEDLVAQFCVVSLDARKRITADGITIWPYQEFLRELWDNRIFLFDPAFGD